MIAWLSKGHGELLRVSLSQVLCFCPVTCKLTFILLVLLTVLGTWTASILPSHYYSYIIFILRKPTVSEGRASMSHSVQDTGHYIEGISSSKTLTVSEIGFGLVICATVVLSI